jgi:hypothetical protein
MKLTAKKLLTYLQSLESEGQDLKKITINYRYDLDSDVKPCSFVEEDLYDSETNSILQSIVIISKH